MIFVIENFQSDGLAGNFGQVVVENCAIGGFLPAGVSGGSGVSVLRFQRKRIASSGW